MLFIWKCDVKINTNIPKINGNIIKIINMKKKLQQKIYSKSFLALLDPALNVHNLLIWFEHILLYINTNGLDTSSNNFQDLYHFLLFTHVHVYIMSPHKHALTLTLTDLNKKYIPVIPARGAQWWSPEGAPPAFGIPRGRASHWWGPIGLVELDRRRLSGRYNCSSGPDSGSSDSWPQSLRKKYIQIYSNYWKDLFFPMMKAKSL